jgi:serine/threonine protein kinase
MAPPGPDRGPPDHTPTPATEVLGPAPAAWESGARFSTYEIDSLLASGGMAEVWRAKIVGMEGFEKRIVIKTMLTHFQNRPDLVDMFIAEAQLAARLSHPNIVDVIDFGQLEGRYFIAMEYVPGLSLRFALKRKRLRGERMPIAAVLHVARDVCEALQYMHDLEDATGELGLVHRDLSPDNIIMSTSGNTKLIDFGTARATKRTAPSSAFVGKFRYAAPERIRQHGEDHRSDVYSLGVILYECLVGVRPFEGSDLEVIRAVTSSPCCDPRVGTADVPAQVADVVKKATAANPADRFASAQAMGTALARCLVALGATNKERAVTGALATLLDEAQPIPTTNPSLSLSPSPPMPVSAPSSTPASEAVPQPIGPSGDGSSTVETSLSELEILEASGPIRDRRASVGPVEPIFIGDTEKISIVLPPEAYPSPHAETIRAGDDGAPRAVIDDVAGSADAWAAAPPTPGPMTLDGAIRGALSGSGATSLVGWKRAGVATQEAPASERAVALFDQGLKLRLEGHYEGALAAWELAMRLAPENHLYQVHVTKLRAHLEARRRR